VLSYSVAERTGEIGVWMALGAERRTVLKMLLTQGITVTSVEAVIGLGAALALNRLLANLLFEVLPTDPLTFALALARSLVCPPQQATSPRVGDES
jgi:putative ABC transport system permease protein